MTWLNFRPAPRSIRLLVGTTVLLALFAGVAYAAIPGRPPGAGAFRTPVEVVGAQVTVPPGGSASAFAACPVDTVAVSSGWTASGDPAFTPVGIAAGAHISISTSVRRSNLVEWSITAFNPTADDQYLRVHVYCV